jgi:hypothetical protein
MEELVRASVGGNTFRAFQFNRFGVAGAPSEIFRSWTTQRLERDYRRLVGLASFEAMIGQLSIMATDLDAAWHRATGGVEPVRIGFGRAAKLLGLSVKHLLWHRELSAHDRANLLPLLNVPLDSYTLQGIRLVAPELCIPANASMSFVRDEIQYRAIQLRIRELMPAGCHAVHYEIAAWNLAHPEAV